MAVDGVDAIKQRDLEAGFLDVRLDPEGEIGPCFTAVAGFGIRIAAAEDGASLMRLLGSAQKAYRGPPLGGVVKVSATADDPSVFDLFRKVCLDAQSQVTASGTLEMQTCDDRRCFPPKSIPLAWKFKFIAPDRQRSPVDLRREFEP